MGFLIHPFTRRFKAFRPTFVPNVELSASESCGAWLKLGVPSVSVFFFFSEQPEGEKPKGGRQTLRVSEVANGL